MQAKSYMCEIKERFLSVCFLFVAGGQFATSPSFDFVKGPLYSKAVLDSNQPDDKAPVVFRHGSLKRRYKK